MMNNDELAPHISAIPFSVIELQMALVSSCLEYYSFEVLQPIHSLIQRLCMALAIFSPVAVSQENKCAMREHLNARLGLLTTKGQDYT